ncbi:MAG TPA: hypothetical protein VM582_04695 [Candidatus Thermoplasmatota archaeon]|nr:hypothetical protein [Candidatus Thermoplasmatota archaeon]
MRPVLLATLVVLAAVLAGCTDSPARDEPAAPPAFRLSGVAPDDDGNLTLAAGRGLVVRADAPNASVEVALAPFASTSAFQACARTCREVEVPVGSLVADAALFSLGNLSLNAAGPAGDSAVHFFAEGTETGRWLRWHEAGGEFQLNDGLAVDGDVTALGTIGSRRLLSFAADGEERQAVVNTTVMEGHESILWTRGIGRLANGSASIPLPPLFALMTENERVTVHVTPTSRLAGLWVSEKSNAAIRVESVSDDDAEGTFDFYVMAPRKGSTYAP